ncbi:hypothetical protein MHM582_3494 [Microbacterium sp. HM58-2]|nr:hypothetical protein MHM582_3494 [Microbacterium sp. HM58-2]
MGEKHTLPPALLSGAVRGAVEVEQGAAGIRPRRLTAAARLRCADDGIIRAADDTAGVWLALVTAASWIELEVTVSLSADGLRSPRFPATFLAVVEGQVASRADVRNGGVRRIHPDGTLEESSGTPVTIRLELGSSATPRPVELRLPHAASTVIHSVSASSPVSVADTPSTTAGPRWVHHGSSVSHGHEADGPLGPWPQRAARYLAADLLDLSFAGNAMLDPFVADLIAEQPADLITLKVGINIVGNAAMRRRTLIPALHGFIDRIRDRQPETPVVLFTAVACPAHEHAPGPTQVDVDGRIHAHARPDDPAALTLDASRAAIRHVVAARRPSDPQLHLVEGSALLSEADADLLADGVHPTDAGHRMMAERFVRLTATHPAFANLSRMLDADRLQV